MILVGFSLLLLLREAEFSLFWLLGRDLMNQALSCGYLQTKYLRSMHFLVSDINNVQLLYALNLLQIRFSEGETTLQQKNSLLFNIQISTMATNFDWVKLQNQNDYKFFACVVAEKLRNINFNSEWRESFLKTLLEEIKPVCTFRTYERIQKFLNEIANQKHQEEKEKEAKQNQLRNVKKKDLKSVKMEKNNRKYNANEDEDDDSVSDEYDQDF